jgi:hypothetical protein
LDLEKNDGNLKSIAPSQENTAQNQESPQKQIQKIEEDKVFFSWISKDNLSEHRGTIWHIIMIIFVLMFAVWGFIYEAWTFSLAIIIFAIVYYMVQKTTPTEIPVQISEKGIKIGKIFYPYIQISGFKVRFNPPISNNLTILLKKNLLSEIKINLSEIPAEDLKEFLATKLPELKIKNDSLTDYIRQIFKI